LPVNDKVQKINISIKNSMKIKSHPQFFDPTIQIILDDVAQLMCLFKEYAIAASHEMFK
jgi:hypothetical protein